MRPRRADGGNERHKRVLIPLAATLFSLVALGPMPYGYYQLLRLAFCAVCVHLLIEAPLGSGHRVTLGALAVLYNPILRVPLDSKSIWSLVNLGTVVYLWMLAMQRAPAK